MCVANEAAAALEVARAQTRGLIQAAALTVGLLCIAAGVVFSAWAVFGLGVALPVIAGLPRWRRP
jgi:hypothetical protein